MYNIESVGGLVVVVRMKPYTPVISVALTIVTDVLDTQRLSIAESHSDWRRRKSLFVCSVVG